MCGIFAVFNAEGAADLAFLGLHAQQHRAVEFAGMVTSDGATLHRHAGRGLVREVFRRTDLNRLTGRIALGHIRYPTVEDDPSHDNTQPILANYREHEIAIAHNGNLTNVSELRRGLAGQKLVTSTDTELILRRFCLTEGNSPGECLGESLIGVRGSYALTLLFPDRLIAIRDPSGNRPLSLGKKGQSWFLSSETCAFETIKADFVRDILPGELLVVSDAGLESYELRLPPVPLARCIYEQIYFAHPSSRIFGEYTSEFRIRLGQKLEAVHPVPSGEVVVPVPDSSNFIALGYASSGRSGQFRIGILRSHYIGRTFIEGEQRLREEKAEMKFLPVRSGLAGKVVVLVDDSIVRLTTMPKIVRLLRWVGAKQIHVRIACPEIVNPCRYGIDTPTKAELAAASMSLDEMRAKVGADSLEFLPLEELQKLSPEKGFCYACMNGEYPIPIE